MLDSNYSDLAYRFRWQIALLLVGLIFAAGGVFIALEHKSNNQEVEIITEATDTSVVVEVSGAVNRPGVYKLEAGARIEDALNSAGGLREVADLQWVGKHLNRAQIVADGQKIYIYSQTEVLSANNLEGDNSISNVIATPEDGSININTASQEALEQLHGIGPVYAQKIIENRPYSTREELRNKDIIPQKTYDNIKDLISVY